MVDPDSGDSYLGVLTLIAKALGVTLSSSLHNGGVRYFLISSTSAISRSIVASYLAKFPLFSSKYLNYLDWLACHEMMVNKLHTTEHGRDKAMLLKSSMNSKRTYYNWDHLEVLKSY